MLSWRITQNHELEVAELQVLQKPDCQCNGLNSTIWTQRYFANMERKYERQSLFILSLKHYHLVHLYVQGIQSSLSAGAKLTVFCRIAFKLLPPASKQALHLQNRWCLINSFSLNSVLHFSQRMRSVHINFTFHCHSNNNYTINEEDKLSVSIQCYSLL